MLQKSSDSLIFLQKTMANHGDRHAGFFTGHTGSFPVPVAYYQLYLLASIFRYYLTIFNLYAILIQLPPPTQVEEGDNQIMLDMLTYPRGKPLGFHWRSSSTCVHLKDFGRHICSGQTTGTGTPALLLVLRLFPCPRWLIISISIG